MVHELHIQKRGSAACYSASEPLSVCGAHAPAGQGVFKQHYTWLWSDALLQLPCCSSAEACRQYQALQVPAQKHIIAQ